MLSKKLALAMLAITIILIIAGALIKLVVFGGDQFLTIMIPMNMVLGAIFYVAVLLVFTRK